MRTVRIEVVGARGAPVVVQTWLKAQPPVTSDSLASTLRIAEPTAVCEFVVHEGQYLVVKEAR